MPSLPILSLYIVFVVIDADAFCKNQQTAHQADGLGRSAHARAVKWRECILETSPVYLDGKVIQLMTLVEHIGQGIK